MPMGRSIEAALAKTGGKSDNADAFVKALRAVTLADTPRGPISFDDHGNAVIDVYVRRTEKQGGKMVNKTIKTYQQGQPVLDDGPEEVPRAAGLLARLPADEKLGREGQRLGLAVLDILIEAPALDLREDFVELRRRQRLVDEFLAAAKFAEIPRVVSSRTRPAPRVSRAENILAGPPLAPARRD